MRFCRIKNIQFLLPIILAFLFSLISTSAFASEFELAIQAGKNFGGDTSIEDLKDIYGEGHPLPAGAGLSLSLGVEYKLPGNRYIRGLVSYVTNSIKGSELNSNSRFEFEWSHIPIDVLYYKKSGNSIYGLGASMHFNPKVKGSGFFSGQNESYKPAIGLLAEIDLILSKKVYVGLKYTVIDYKSNTRGKISGNSFGIVTGYSFPIGN